MNAIKYTTLASMLAINIGCTSLLPTKTTTTHSNWSSYQQVNELVSKVKAGQSTTELKAIGIDLTTTKNIEVLTHLDIAKRFGLIGFKDESLVVPVGIKALMAAAEKGKGYELTVRRIVDKREGAFWQDFLGFKQTTKKTGWDFSVLVIVVDDRVQYVLHRGNPNIDETTVERNPLGPFQRVNGYVLVDLLENVIR